MSLAMSFRFEEVQQLRHQLHREAELAFAEHRTGETLRAFLEPYQPTQVLTGLGGTGLAAVFAGDPHQPKILLRADLDALPISEGQSLPYHSKDPLVSHKCGHDGHMAIVASVAQGLASISQRGDVILFFQPGEEVGEGAQRCLQDPQFKKLTPDYIFGLHNLPEFPAGEVVIRRGTFACCSLGLKVKIQGRSAHAAHPSAARSPFIKFYHLSQELKQQNHEQADSDFFLSTLTHVKLGEESFGITPGDLTAFFTLRAARDEVLSDKQNAFMKSLQQSFNTDFDLQIETLDEFPATINSDEAVDFLMQSLRSLQFSYQEIAEPLRWSEDFGYFTRQIPGAYFGLGVGCKSPLHSKDYDFNDAVLQKGQAIYLSLIRAINQAHSGKNQ
jgi:amidohydrolase